LNGTVTDERQTRGLDIITAVLLGLVSVVTAIGAVQAAGWDAAAAEFERDSSDARSVSINQSVQADFAQRNDLEASVTARGFAEQRVGETDPLELALLDNRTQAALSSTTSGFSDAWFAWQARGFDPTTDPIDDPDYLVSRDGFYQSYGVVGAVLDDLSKQTQARSSVLAQAALIQALALFLIGIAGVNRVRAVRIAILSLGALVFLVGVVVALSSSGAGS
jgi:hypothetical protein